MYLTRIEKRGAPATHLGTDVRSGYADDGQNDQRVEEDAPRKDHQSGVEVGKEDVVQHVACARDVGPVAEKLQVNELKASQSFVLSKRPT